MNRARRMIPTMPLNGRKDRDEDLLLFRELHKREKDRLASLLQPVSDEFEPNGGNYALYRIASGKKGSGYEFLAENDKNDYDWLKTPPATPLFPSLEMEATAAPQLVVQRELPITQHLSRFSGKPELSKPNTEKPKSPTPKPKVPVRSITPSQRPKGMQVFNQKATQPTANDHPSTKKPNGVMISTAKPTNQKNSQTDFLISNLYKNTVTDSKTKPRSRGVSPSVRSTIPAQFPGFSNDTPPNLRTDRSSSATRGRPAGNPAGVIQQKPEPTTPNPRRQSCSPSVTRGRRVEQKQDTKGSIQTGNGAQILGSRMVEKLMNARKTSIEEREMKQKPRDSINEGNGFGRMMTRSSLDTALKHMEIKRDRHHIGIFPIRGCTKV